MNNNTKSRWKQLTKKDRQKLGQAGLIRKSKRAKVAGSARF